MQIKNNSTNNWPVLNFSKMQDTIETLHQWLQIVGKIRLKTMPWQNHSWHTSLYVTSVGFSTHSIPYQGNIFHIEFDFKASKLIIQCSNAQPRTMELMGKTVADFYHELFVILENLGINVKIHTTPNEIAEAIPFEKNTTNKPYNPEHAKIIWHAFLKSNEVFNQFRSGFIGKASPVHLFWGAFDLAVTRFSGKSAPLHQSAVPNMPKEVMQEAYSQEVSSAGFWLGSKEFPQAAFYSYSYPATQNFGEQKVSPINAFYSPDMGEFFLTYADVQNSDNPEEILMQFLESTYEAAANTLDWDRKKLEHKT